MIFCAKTRHSCNRFDLVARIERVITLGFCIFGINGIGLYSTTVMAVKSKQDKRIITEILVHAPRQAQVNNSGHHHATQLEIRRLDTYQLSGLLKLVPGAVLQTNSRGESQVYLRNAGERQGAVFLDGALLNIPWDNRVDLSVVPAQAIGTIDTFTGGASLQFGANVVGGAFNLTSRQPANNKSDLQFEAVAGSNALLQFSLVNNGGQDNSSFLAALSHAQHGDRPLPDEANLPYNQSPGQRRTNSDFNNSSILLRGNFSLSGDIEVGVTSLFSMLEKGVAPVGHLDPAQSSVRFWRYPDTLLSMLIVNAKAGISTHTVIKGASWLQKYDQNIDSYTGMDYLEIDQRQVEENLAFGSRFSLAHSRGLHDFVFSFNGLLAEHQQHEEFSLPQNQFRPAPRLNFSERTMSVAGEYAFQILEELSIRAGVGLDWKTFPKTGDKTPVNDFLTANAIAGLYFQSNNLSLRATLARKTRTPSMRELFGESLNRFLVNPSLKEEKILLTELGLEHTQNNLRLELVGFFNRSENNIDQRFLILGGEVKRQRINLRGSRTTGLELNGSYRADDRFTVEGHLTIMDIKRYRDNSGDPGILTEKPRVIARMALNYRANPLLFAALEIEHRGRAYSQDEMNRLVPLEISTLINLRFAWDLVRHRSGGAGIQLFVRLDNLTNTRVVSQLGLPEAGRWLSFGLRSAF